jgi:hypothetical protein
MKRVMFAALGVIFAIALFTPTVNAFTTSEKVVVANDLIAVARVPAGGMTADQRIGTVNDRLAYIIGYEPLKPSAIRISQCNGQTVIIVGRTTLITVTREDAQANHTTINKLAQEWLKTARVAIPESRPIRAVPG